MPPLTLVQLWLFLIVSDWKQWGAALWLWKRRRAEGVTSLKAAASWWQSSGPNLDPLPFS